MKQRLFLFILTVLFTASCFSQFSKTHYIPPLSASFGVEPQEQYLYISCPSTTPINFQIQQIGGTSIIGSVSRDTPYIYSIGFGFDTQLLVSENDVSAVLNNKGFIVQAEDLIYVTVRLTATPNFFHAGGLVSKGNAALGTNFRIGAFINTGAPNSTESHYTFASILATENNTLIQFDDIKTGVTLINNAGAGNTPASITLNAGETYVLAVKGPSDENRDGLIGALINSNKPIAVNCGSFAGSNGSTPNLDVGFDQIVSEERTGLEYIFVKGSGVDVTERPLIVAHQDNTEIFLDGNTVPTTTLNAGEYLALDGSQFSVNENLYVRASKNIFAYQGIGGSQSQANQNMHFLPPLSCQTPKSINNIPFINEVGGLNNFEGTVCIVTKTGATLNFIINGTSYTLAGLPNNITITGPLAVTGNTDFVTYTFQGLNGNISVFSSEQVYLSYYGSSGAATYGGFYSGFTFKPEVTFQPVLTSLSNCIPNINLQISSISGFDVFQWYFNGNPISGATTSSYTPTQPGYYKVKATLSECGIDLFSDEIPVSDCPTDLDSDTVVDNIDLDYDGDGITNCTESFGNQDLSLVNPTSGTINIGPYSNSYTGVVTTSAVASAIPFTGNSNGSFVTDVPAGKTNWVKYELTFTQPISFGLEYVSTANATDLLNSNAEYIINSPINKTVSVLNPNNELLIDTNYDGFYESGITEYSSFEIRFRVNSTTPLAAGTGTFRFITYQSGSLSFTHKNLTDSFPNKSTLKFYASCVPKDSDGDGVPDQLDFDSDNDGIPDYYEAQGSTFVAISNVDTNNDGIDDAYGTGVTPVDSDNDGVEDYFDLDSDNDGIYDLTESGSSAIDANANGIIDGTNFGTNGLNDALETSLDSNIINYTIANTDGDATNNYLDLESDSDGCNDVIEAGFTDANNDGILGNSLPTTVNNNGIVTNGVGYTTPNPNYIITAPISVTTQPADEVTCELQSATFTLIPAVAITTYQWELSVDNGLTWTTVVNNTTYSGATTIALTVNSVSPTMNGYKYRVFLNRVGNSCGLYSDDAILTTYALPVVSSPISLIQCDTDTDGVAPFNLTVKNNFISANAALESFSYFTTFTGANTNDSSVLITNPLAYNTPNSSVWVSVVNANGCANVTRLDLIVSVTQLPSSFIILDLHKCDDYIDTTNNEYDGIATFDFTPIYNSIQAFLPPPSSNYTIKFYKNLNDFNAETDSNGISLAINPISNYRNIGYPNQQTIYVRVDSNIDNSCFGDKTFNIIVEPTPIFYTVGINNVIRHCDDDQDGTYGFDTSTIETSILQGQTGIAFSYFDATGTPLPSPLPNPFLVNSTNTITVRMTNNPSLASDGPCYYEKNITFIVDDKPEAFAVLPNRFVTCDDEINDPATQDGLITFNTATLEADILQGQTGMVVTYTLQDGTVLSTLAPTFESGTQNVLVTVTNVLNSTCPATTTLNFVVHPIPIIDLNLNGQANELVCTNLPTFTVSLDAGIIDGTPTTNYTYQWFLEGILIPGATNYSITVNTGGTYTVTVNNIFGCPTTRTIEVTTSVIASIEDINIIDLTDLNSVEVIVSGNGDYVYSIQEPYGPYQTSPIFTNVPIGIHTVYIKDLNGCGIAQQTISVVGAPQFFTPNGDGFNDTWNLKGVSNRFYANSIIYIYDRYGKLIKQIAPLGQGWDGTYNGTLAPGDDYWYTIKLDDGRSTKGHFSLKR
jgi:gliding motility-associated-like protein